MRNDVHLVPPDADDPKTPAAGGRAAGEPDVNKPEGGEDFDQEHGSSVRREHGDSVDPAGPKPTQAVSGLGEGGAVPDPSGTTGTVSRSNDRLSTTTGKLGDRDLERSARQGEAPDVRALSIPTGDSSMSVPIVMAVAVVVVAILGLIVFLSWPSDAAVEPAGGDVTTPTAQSIGDE